MSEGTERRVEARAPIALAASFTLGPIADHLALLSARLAWPAPLRAVPYGRFAAQLSDPAGHFWAPASFRAILLRPEDLGEAPETSVQLITDALAAGDDGTPLLLVLGHNDRAMEEKAAAPLERLAAVHAHIEIIRAHMVFDEFGIDDPADELTGRTGHLPYGEDAMAALALDLGRWIDRLMRPPVKLVAVDGDNTLWSGVLGEDGVEGVKLAPGHAGLQTRLREAAARGLIVTLLTKNEETEIRALLSGREDFPLSPEDFFDIHAGWGEKSVALGQLAAAHGVAQEAILFLDDSPVETARMRESLPGVLTIDVPEDGPSGEFLEALWPLDTSAATADDEKRVSRLRQEAVRQEARKGAKSLDEFFATLDLRIDMFAPGNEGIARLSQLSQRTNQFNSSLLRLGEADLKTRMAEENALLRAVYVADRFGDYGLVGMALGRMEGGELILDLFCLSCRVLGRGVEHCILRQLMEETDAGTLSIRHVTGPRNQPMRQFLARLAKGQFPAEGMLRLDREDVTALHFDPSSETGGSEDLIAPAIDGMARRASFYQAVARRAHDGAPPSQLFAERRERPSLETSFVPPQGEAEAHIARIWQEVLGVSPVGREDSFSSLGGKSLHLVRIHARLTRELGAELPLADLFRFPSVRYLAAHLASKEETTSDRAAAMRAARMRRPRRVS